MTRRVAEIAAAALVASFALGCLPHSNWWWGANLLHFYPLGLRLLWTLVALAALAGAWALAGRGRPEALAPAAVPADKGGAGPPPVALATLAGLGAGIVFHLARTRHALLGDGYTILGRLVLHEPLATGSPAWDRIEPALVGLVQRLRGPALNLTRAGGSSTLTGALFVGVVTLLLARRARAGRGTSGAVMAALLLTQPALQLFCGYVGPEALLAAALGLLLLLLNAGADAGGRRLAPAWSFLAAGLVVAELAGRLIQPGGAGLHFPADPVRLTDTLNQAWLVGAPALIVLAALATLPAGRAALRAPGGRPALVVTLALFAARLCVRTPLGSMRDWALFGGVGVGLTAWAAAALAALPIDPVEPAEPGADEPRPGARPLVLALGVTGLFFLGPWLGLQALAERGVDRHLSMVEGAPPLAPPVAARFHEAMGDRFTWMGQPFLAAQAYRRGFRALPSFEDAWRSGLAYMACGRVEDAGGAFTECTKRRPRDWRAWTELGNALTGLNEFTRADSALRTAIALNPAAAAPRIHLARGLAMDGRGREARTMLESARPRLDRSSALARDFDRLDENLPE